VTVEELRIDEKNLTTQRMLDLMAVNTDDGNMPLYLHSINRILRELRIIQQHTNDNFNYRKFKKMVDELDLTSGQKGPLTQRLDTLESFMPKSQTLATGTIQQKGNKMKKTADSGGNDWTLKICMQNTHLEVVYLIL